MAAVGGLAAVVLGLTLAQPPDWFTQAQVLETEVQRQLAHAGVRRGRLVEETRTLARSWGRPYQVVDVVYQCPPRFSPEAFTRELTKAVTPAGFDLLRSERRQADGARVTILALGFRGRPLYRLTLREPFPLPTAAAPVVPTPRPLRARAKVAIVLDDWGYNRTLVPEVLRLNRPVTFAILPHQPYSATIAGAVQGTACEVILHLPMEPHNADSPREPKVLIPGMSSQMVRRMLDEALATVPHARGISNHQGSKATEDARLMQLLLADLRRRQLLFLDSLVTDKSVCRQIATGVGLPFAERAVFLDNVETPEAVRQQLVALAEAALRTGRAIGIGHDKRVTIEALRELIPQMEQQGIEFVRLSDVAQVVTSNEPQ